MSFIQPVDEATLIVYYCKETQKIVPNPEVKPGTKYTFIDPETGAECVWGPVRSIVKHFRIKESSENGKLLLKIQEDKIQSLKDSSD